MAGVIRLTIKVAPGVLRLIGASRGSNAGGLAPGSEGSVPSSTVIGGSQPMAADLEMIADAAVGGEEALGVAG